MARIAAGAAAFSIFGAIVSYAVVRYGGDPIAAFPVYFLSFLLGGIVACD